MLGKLHEAFCNDWIKHYWDDAFNLLEKISYAEMRNMEGRLRNILKDIEKTIKNDPYAIAKWVCEYIFFSYFK